MFVWYIENMVSQCTKDALMMMPEQRYDRILELMRVDGMVKSAQLRERLNASYETIRRDLEALEERGLIRRTHGGAILVNGTKPQPGEYEDFRSREVQNVERKMEVAEFAAGFVREGQSIALDSGTTASRLAEVLARRFHSLTVVTNSLRIANQLVDKSGFTVILTGGIVKSDEYSLTSDMAVLIFSQVSSIDTFFMTSCGASPERGVTYQRLDEIPVQNKMLEVSEKTYLLIDSSKLGANSLIKMCELSSISGIITDSDVTADQIARFSAAGASIIKPQQQ